MYRVRRVTTLIWRYWPTLLRAGVVVLAFRLGLTFLSYGRVKHWVPAVRGPVADDRRLAAMMWAIDQTARRIPKASCLTQALAGQYLCAREGRPTKIRIGVIPDGAAFRAHAWLLDGERVLIGGVQETLSDFTPMVDLGSAHP